MTRQKKELKRQINEIEKNIAVDEWFGCGFAPADAYDSMYEKIWELSEKLARLSHYADAEEMMMDNRWMIAQIKSGRTIQFPFA